MSEVTTVRCRVRGNVCKKGNKFGFNAEVIVFEGTEKEMRQSIEGVDYPTKDAAYNAMKKSGDACVAMLKEKFGEAGADRTEVMDRGTWGRDKSKLN